MEGAGTCILLRIAKIQSRFRSGVKDLPHWRACWVAGSEICSMGNSWLHIQGWKRQAGGGPARPTRAAHAGMGAPSQFEEQLAGTRTPHLHGPRGSLRQGSRSSPATLSHLQGAGRLINDNPAHCPHAGLRQP